MKKLIYANTAELTDEEMEAEMQAHFKELDAKLDKFMSGRRVNKMKVFEDGQWTYIERRSLNDFIRWDIRYFNENVAEYGNGFETDWDEDAVMNILYKDGRIRRVSLDDDDGTKKISTDNIEAIILDSGWGTAIAGNPNSIVLYNYREAVEYGPYGYKSVAQRYYDDDDIRADFNVDVRIR